MKMILTLAALAAAAVSAPALAQTAPAPEVVRVSVADLDLGSAAGRSALDHRIRAAVQDFCGTASPADLRGSNAVYRCRADLAARLNLGRDSILASRAGSGTTAAR